MVGQLPSRKGEEEKAHLPGEEIPLSFNSKRRKLIKGDSAKSLAP